MSRAQTLPRKESVRGNVLRTVERQIGDALVILAHPYRVFDAPRMG